MPGNILLTWNNVQVKLIDFGVSKRFKRPNGDLITMSTLTGTKSFCAPETFLHGEYT